MPDNSKSAKTAYEVLRRQRGLKQTVEHPGRGDRGEDLEEERLVEAWVVMCCLRLGWNLSSAEWSGL